MKLTLFSCLVLTVLTATGRADYTIVDLGLNVSPRVINNAGVVAGTDLQGDLVRYDGAEQLIAPPAGFSVGVSGINQNGVICGGLVLNSQPTQTVAYNYDGTFNQIPYDGNSTSFAYGINNAGHMALTVGGGGVWITTDGMTAQYIAGGVESPYAINSQDQITDRGNGNLFFSAGTTEADIATPGGKTAVGYAITDSGYIAGDFFNQKYGWTDGFLYHNGSFENLPTLGGIGTEVWSVNDNGVAVGRSATTTELRAFIYSDGAMTDLNSLISPSSGWFLGDAFGINDSGEIVGEGTLNGTPHGFILVPTPEPSVLALVAFSLISFRRRRYVAN